MRFDAMPQTIGWFREQYRAEHLKLKKPYQRNPVWSHRQKCSLIETILLELPIPEVFIEIQSTAAGEVEYGVIDGQQRIRAILQFVGAELDPAEAEEYNLFRLDKLDDANSRWRNMGFDDLSDEDKKRFFSTKLAVRQLMPQNDDETRDMFKRLNKYMTPLNNQELRNATYSGPFATLAKRLADDEYWAENKIVIPSQIRRMIDVEFLSELLIGVMHGPQDGNATDVDEHYRQFEDYEDEFPGQRDTEALFADSLAAIKALLPNIKQTRWHNKADFYSLMVTFAHLLRGHSLPTKNHKRLRAALDQFAAEVSLRLSDAETAVGPEAAAYVRGIEKRVNAKGQRTSRWLSLRAVVLPHFQPGAATK